MGLRGFLAVLGAPAWILDLAVFFGKDKSPRYNETGFDSPITEVALALVGNSDDVWDLAGTGVFIAPRLAITAAHVVEGFYNALESKEIDTSKAEVTGSFLIYGVQVLDGGKSAALWRVKRFHKFAATDVAVLELAPVSESAARYSDWKIPRIDPMPPAKGTIVSHFGYPRQKLDRMDADPEKIEWTIPPRTSMGTVQEVVHDRGYKDFPHYQTNTLLEGNASGSPVFNSRGELCGLAVAGFSKAPPGESDVSYIATLWPLLGLPLVVEDATPHMGDRPYPFIELARKGIVHVSNHDAVYVDYRDEILHSIGHWCPCCEKYVTFRFGNDEQ